jgi:hypothetical protein
MKKIISAIICLTLIFGLTSLKTNKSDNRKYFKNLAINIEKDYSKNNNSPKDFPKEFPEEFPYDKLAIDLKENSETKTADNTNHQENEKEDSQYTLISSLNTNIINIDSIGNLFDQDHRFNFTPSVPTSPPNC